MSNKETHQPHPGEIGSLAEQPDTGAPATAGDFVDPSNQPTEEPGKTTETQQSQELPLEEESSDEDEHDHDYQPDPDLRDLPLSLGNIPRFLLLSVVRLYQATFSRTLPPDTCRFYPSCSHYGYQAIYKYGVIKGGLMAAWRVLRCNPFNKGGFDPVP